MELLTKVCLLTLITYLVVTDKYTYLLRNYLLYNTPKYSKSKIKYSKSKN